MVFQTEKPLAVHRQPIITIIIDAFHRDRLIRRMGGFDECVTLDFHTSQSMLDIMCGSPNYQHMIPITSTINDEAIHHRTSAN
jgi:hypothetical protein